MKVAILVPSLRKKGPVIVAVNLAKKLKAHEIDVTIFSLDINSNDFDLYSIKVEKLGPRTFHKLKKFNVIHSHSLIPDLYNALQAYIFNVKSVTTIHNDIFEDLSLEYPCHKAKIINFLWRFAFRKISQCVCLTQFLRDKYAKNIPALSQKLSFVYNGVSPKHDEYLSENDIDSIRFIQSRHDDGRVIVGTCCVITKRKGLEHLIGVASRLPSHDFFIIGDGSQLSNLKELSIGLNNMFFLKPTRNPLRYMALFDLYVMPSLSEGFGLATIEALIVGCDLVCSDIPTFREMFSDDISYFSLGDLNSLENALLTAKKNTKVISEKYRDKFSQEKMCDGYINIYKNL
ncbi:glycosyltransferase family 4 protein [Vibrio cholerae]|nr:glycosyltransferase family 4 protein [Vibrio cholerae]